jgi:6-phosphogluconolactonase (cycloisomerase 2 family)
MRTRFTWILGILTLVLVGVLIACGGKYSSSSNGLVVVSTQGDEIMETFSLNLSNGHVSQINNVNGPPTLGAATAVILDPAGAFAYVIVNQVPGVPGTATGIATFSIAPDGKLSQIIATTPVTTPVAIAMDSAGKFLFVASGTEGTISVFSIGSNASLTPVAGSPFALPLEAGGQSPSASALAVTPTVFPILGTQNSPCSGFTAPTTENLYVTDSLNNVVLNYSISTTGTLALVPASAGTPGVATGTVPSGVTVDPCNRFVYVANQSPNNSVSAYTICNGVSVILPNCPLADYSLHPVTGSPFTVGDLPGPLLVDPLGEFLYVLDTGSSEISVFRISSAGGGLTALSPATVATNSSPTSMAIRGDDQWLFVANLNSANVSLFAITPASGALTPETAIETDNYPWGVAVK